MNPVVGTDGRQKGAERKMSRRTFLYSNVPLIPPIPLDLQQAKCEK